MLLKFVQHGLPLNLRRQQHVVHVSVVHAFIGYDGSAQHALGLQRLEQGVITVPDLEAILGDLLRIFKLGP
ncbi:hypothetical protein D3C73_1378390 [compost metagenome]